MYIKGKTKRTQEPRRLPSRKLEIFAADFSAVLTERTPEADWHRKSARLSLIQNHTERTPEFERIQTGRAPEFGSYSANS